MPGTDGTLHARTPEVCALPSSPRRRIKKPISLPSVRPASPPEGHRFPFRFTWETWRCSGQSVDRSKRRRGQEGEDRGAASGLTLPWATSSCLGWAAVRTQVLGPRVPHLDTAPRPARDPSCFGCRAPAPDREHSHSGNIRALGAEESSGPEFTGGRLANVHAVFIPSFPSLNFQKEKECFSLSSAYF